jgi:exopolysaccharide biosynthesis polyprenyl glycosylphosphotransferase
MPVKELLELRLSGVMVEEGTTLLEKVTGQIEVEELRPSWLIFGNGFRLRPKHWVARRVVSTISALILSAVTLIFVPLIAILIKLTSKGPVLYRQKRVGLNGKVFECYKFRTMRSDAEADTGPTWACDDDPRITKVGHFLRASRLDEIPQLWNVLKGDMAFVGPRPERPEFVEKLSQAIPYYNLRHATRPGITGWAQTLYKYGNTVEDSTEKLRYDLYYIKNCSPGLDLWIIFNTIRTVLLGKGAK